MSLARIERDALTPSARIASAMGIPPRFLPQVMGDLVHAGIAEGVVGRAGGYRLARPPERINLLEVIEAAEGSARRRTCILTGVVCGAQEQGCDVHAVVSSAQESLLGTLRATSLADVIGRVPERTSGDGRGLERLAARLPGTPAG